MKMAIPRAGSCYKTKPKEHMICRGSRRAGGESPRALETAEEIQTEASPVRKKRAEIVV